LDRELHLIYAGSLYGYSDILEMVNRYRFELEAIDAPLSLPKDFAAWRRAVLASQRLRVWRGAAIRNWLSKVFRATSLPKNLLLRL
jgi:hypothetical protein